MKYTVYTGILNIRTGGPSGYLANLKAGIDSIDRDNIEFLCNKKEQIKSKSNLKKDIKKILTERLSFLGESYIENMYYTKLFKYDKNNIENILSNYEDSNNNIVHFHMAIDFYNAYNKVKNSKTILTTHNPECFASEYINGLNSINNKKYKFNKLRSKLIECQSFAYKNADNLIFPSPESLEPYYKSIEGFEEIIKNKNIYYNMTGCRKLDYKLSKEEFRKIYKIENKFVVSYVGRKNEIKGYDLFLELAKKIQSTNSNIIFITAGTGHINSLNCKNVIDIGWTDDPGSIINASDLFILPNRMTYFDLILLEVMSIGKAVLASNTGGNITISNISEGVKLFKSEDIEDMENKILDLYKDKDKLNRMGKCNLESYYKYFTIEKFAERYLDILDKIENNI